MKKVRLLALAALTAAGVVAATAAPAAADGHGSAAGCTWNTADATFSSLGSLDGSGSSARSDDPLREPDLGQEVEDLPASAKGKAKQGFHAEIPVYFHVVTDGSIGSLTRKNIHDQITVLNLTFAGFYGGTDTGFSFELAGITRTDNAAWFYAGPTTKAEFDMKRALKQGGDNALNLYSTTAGPYLGWAYYPSITEQPGQKHLDGIVVDWESMPGTSDRYAGRYDLGYTATHEVGHWVNLAHTFQGGCTNPFGDYVADTPAEGTPTSGCPAGKDSCPDLPGLDPIHNYMDYSYDSCYFEFTPDQTQRAQDAWLLYRAS